MKKIYAIIASVFFISSFAKADVGIGNGTNTAQSLPMEAYFGYSYSQSIYLQSEINTGGNITSIQYYFAGNGIGSSDSITIYMGHTSMTSFSGNTDWVPSSSLTEVFRGVIPNASTLSPGWITFTFTTPFSYNNTDNLVVAFEEDRGGYDSPNDDFYSTQVTGNRSIYYRSDNTNPNPASPPSANNTVPYIPNIILGGITQSCPYPSNLSGSINASGGFDFTWTENGSATNWEIEYDTVGFTLGTGNNSITSTNPTTLTGLQAGNSYDFYVKSVCGPGDSSSWVGPISILVPCGLTTPATLPWTEDFESVTAQEQIGDGNLMCVADHSWDFLTDRQTSGRVKFGSQSPVNNGGSGAALMDRTGPYFVTANQLILTIDLSNYSSSTNLVMDFDWAQFDDDNNSGDRIWVRGDNNATTPWIEVYNWNAANSTSSEWNSIEGLPISYYLTTNNQSPSSTFQIKFGQQGYSSYQYDGFGLDNLVIKEASCPKPINFTLDYSNMDTASFSWTPTGSETAWVIEYGLSGFTLGSGQSVAVTAPHDSITGLLENSVYDFYVKADCGSGNESSWVGPVTYGTPITNDTACGAILVQADGSTNNYSNIGATRETGDISTRNSSVWFKTVVPASGHLAIATCGTSFDTYLNVFTGSNCSDYASYTSIGNADSNPFGSSNCSGAHPAGIELCDLTPGDTITFSVQSYSSGANNQGIFPLRVWDLALEAGSGSQFDICYTDSVNLWTHLSGQGDARGSWKYPNNPNAISNDSIFLAPNATAGGDEIYYIVSNSCMADTATVTVSVKPASSAGEDGNINACKGQQINLYEGLGGLIDIGGNWFDSQNNALTSGDIISGAIPGSYNYDYIANNGVCPNDTATVTVIVADCIFVGIEEVELANLSIFPNPTSELLYISNNGSNEVFNYSVMDLNGKVVASKENAINGTQTTEISLANIERGIYLIRIFNEQAEKTVRVVKQ